MRIFLADNQDFSRRGLRQALTDRRGWTVCGEARNGVVILEMDLPALDGIEAARKIKAMLPQTEILFLTMCEEEYRVAEALRAGASGYVLKSDGDDKGLEAVEYLARQLPFFTPKVTRMLLKYFVQRGVPAEEAVGLTEREVEVVRLLADGKPNKEVAALLGISMKTVETHRSAVMRKLDVKSITELVRYAIRLKLIEA
jgi:DNA-binding NarL/FixJ family response regulator